MSREFAMRTSLGILWFIVIIWNGLVIAKRRRRSGMVRDYGHPVEDKFLLFGSAMIFVAVMLTISWRIGPRMPERGSAEWLFAVFCLAVFASGFTFVSNRILRLGRGKRRRNAR